MSGPHKERGKAGLTGKELLPEEELSRSLSFNSKRVVNKNLGTHELGDLL